MSEWGFFFESLSSPCTRCGRIKWEWVLIEGICPECLRKEKEVTRESGYQPTDDTLDRNSPPTEFSAIQCPSCGTWQSDLEALREIWGAVTDLCPACAAKRIASLEAQLAQAQGVHSRDDADAMENARRFFLGDAPPGDNAEIEERIAVLHCDHDCNWDGIAAELRRLYALVARYAPQDGDERSTEELIEQVLACVDDHLSFWAEPGRGVVLGWDHDQEGVPDREAWEATARAALRKALEEEGK